MKFQDYREKIAPEEVESHAECLAAMDCLMHHMSDEDELACWLQDAVPDSDNWRPFEDIRSTPDDRSDYYMGLVRGMTYGDYEGCVKVFACAVKAQCFETRYQPRSFT